MRLRDADGMAYSTDPETVHSGESTNRFRKKSKLIPHSCSSIFLVEAEMKIHMNNIPGIIFHLPDGGKQVILNRNMH